MNIESIIRDNIDRIYHLSLGTSQNNQPWVSEVHFAYDDDLNLYYRSLPSRRHSEDIAINPNVAGNIVRQHDLNDSVLGLYFEGTAERLDPNNLDEAFKALNQRLRVGEGEVKEANDPNGHQFYKITVSDWYVFGNFDNTSSRKYHWDRT